LLAERQNLGEGDSGHLEALLARGLDRHAFRLEQLS
jgi:hypothetical protein